MSATQYPTQYVEGQIINSLLDELIGYGFTISVNDGEETTLKRSYDKEAITKAMQTTDEDWIYVHTDDPLIHRAIATWDHTGTKDCAGWVRLIYGNGEDLISDYNTRLEPYIAKTEALVERIGA